MVKMAKTKKKITETIAKEITEAIIEKTKPKRVVSGAFSKRTEEELKALQDKLSEKLGEHSNIDTKAGLTMEFLMEQLATVKAVLGMRKPE